MALVTKCPYKIIKLIFFHFWSSQGALEACALEDMYEIERVLSWIQELDLKKIALQFPDELLKDAPDVALKIELSSKIEVHILGDTSYGR